MNALTFTTVAAPSSRPGPGPCPVIETARLVLRHRLGDAERSPSRWAISRWRACSRAYPPLMTSRMHSIGWRARPSGLTPTGRWRSPPVTTCISAASALSSGTANGMSAIG